MIGSHSGEAHSEPEAYGSMPGRPSGRPDGLGVVIPTLDESAHLPGLLDDLNGLVPRGQIVISDGGSRDGTTELAATRGVRIIHARMGRGRQLNAGAGALDTAWLLFLHADCRMPRSTWGALLDWLADPPDSQAAHFRFALGERRWYGPVLERGQRVREHMTGLAYGDQGLVISRARFRGIGGFPPLPVLEDVEIVRSLRRTGGLDRIDAPLPTSSRRYERTGPIRGWLRNVLVMSLYLGGVPPARLSRFYGSPPG